MERVLALDLVSRAKDAPGKEVRVIGWVHRIRELGGVTFIILRDRSGMVQLVSSEKPVDTSGAALTLESVIQAEGLPALNEKAPGGAELAVKRIKILSRAAADLP
jgi:nondiscriminating aspartyl-tRNA synthetase